MPEPIARGQRYMPGLDGLRALAVLSVIAYHLGVNWTPGGLLGVGVFFTLSGYLITDILLAGWASGRGRLGDFWLRRARRLLPALYVMLAVVGLWVALGHRSQLSQFRGDALSAALYVNNWWNIFHHVSYFARFGPPSPLNHLWSLAVEEQFYLLWPWLLLLGLRLVGEPARTPFKPRLALLTLALAGASALEMALLYHPSLDPSRIYEGTDTRAFGLLLGAALAMVWPSRGLRGSAAAGAGRILDGLGLAGLIVIGLLVWRTGQYSSFLYHGGLVALSLATVLVIAAAVHPASRLGGLLGRQPLRWIGVRSYGIYLWHVPLIVLTTPALAQGFSAPRAALQLLATFVVADISWRLIESPVRRGALGAALARARAGGWRAVRARYRLGLLAFGALAGAAIAAVLVVHAAPPSPASAAPGSPVAIAPGDPTAQIKPPAGRRHYQLVSQVVSGNPRRTSCRSVAHFGDSTSDGLNSPNYLPDPSQRISAQYARVGAVHQVYEIHGGDSIVEHLSGQPDMYSLAQGLKRSGYRGCWVLALGTNDTADVYVGSNVGAAQRIKRMMSLIGSAPVMWVNVRSLVAGGPYAEANMQAWNRALYRACARHPNMRVFNWAAVARPRWFIADGIHYTSPGYRYRAELIADALARAFPAEGHSRGCLVNVGLPSSSRALAGRRVSPVAPYERLLRVLASFGSERR
jgi:peptidoglycan/LPS O-acetylase OafA/YrhL